MDFYCVSDKWISWIIFGPYDDLTSLQSDFNDLVVDSRIIKIPSQQKKDQYGTDNIVIEDGEYKNAGKNYGKQQIP